MPYLFELCGVIWARWNFLKCALQLLYSVESNTLSLEKEVHMIEIDNKRYTKELKKAKVALILSEWNKTGFNMQLCVLCKSYTSRHEKRPTTAQKWHNTQHVPNRFSFVINLFVGPVVCFVWARNAAHRHKSTVIFLFSVSKTLCQIHADLFYCTVVINLKLDIYYLKVLSVCLCVSRAIRSEPVN